MTTTKTSLHLCLGTMSGLVALVAAFPTSAAAETLYVDSTIPAACTSYAAATRSCEGGDARAFVTLSGGASALAAGDVLVLRGGAYEEVLRPTASGRADAPITIRGADGEAAIIENVDSPALFLRGVSYLVVEDLSVRDVLGFGRLEDSDHITIRRVRFERARASGTTGGLKLVRATQCRIDSNQLIDSSDNLVMQESDSNLIIDNEFREGSHSLLSVRCSNRNVFRGNRFDNPSQKAMEIYDCEGVSDAPYRLDATRRNLIEGNRFEGTLGSDRNHRYNAIQYAGQYGIVRRNVFFDNLGGGLAFQVYSDEALNNYGHRAYHNTFVDNRCNGLIGSRAVSDTFYDNTARFNVLLGNVGCAGEPEQTNIRNPDAVVLSDNVLVDVDPGFVDRVGRDFTLSSGSRLVDAAGYLARARGAGEGTRLGVDDAYPFFDGNGIEGEVGDTIQLEGDAARATVVSIDLSGGLLELDRPLTWADGQGVALAYEGSGPDVGAHERGLTVVPPRDAGLPPRDGGVGFDGGVPADAGSSGDGGRRDGGSGGGGGGDGGGSGVEGGGCAIAPNRSGGGIVWLALVGLGAIAFSRRRG